VTRFYDAETERWLDQVTLGEPIQARCSEQYLVTAEHAELRLVLADGTGNQVKGIEIDLFVTPKALGKLAAAGGIVPFPPAFAEQMGEHSRGVVSLKGSDQLVGIVTDVYDGDIAAAVTHQGPNHFPAAFDLALYEFVNYAEVAGKERGPAN
jgi:hypothetical protein